MKKSLIALAVIAASSAAMAQSSVTLYGIADIYLANTRALATDATAVRANKIESGNASGSRWGVRGSEDLGGGLKANFVFEQGFSIDTGAAGTVTPLKDAAVLAVAGVKTAAAFSRQAWVGLSGGFGATRLGLTTTAFDDVSGASDAIWDSKLSPMNAVFKSIDFIGRPGNTFYYATPSFSGFSAAASYSLGENKVSSVNAGAASSVALVYANGPVTANFGYQTEKVTGALTAKKFTRLGATYDFGVVKALATYGKAENMTYTVGADATDYQLGLDIPVGAALTLSTSYATSKNNAISSSANVLTGGSAANEKRQGWGVGAKYTLSKRTFLIAGYEADNAKVTGTATKKHDLFALGVNHKF